jgi:hypothetical protein
MAAAGRVPEQPTKISRYYTAHTAPRPRLPCSIHSLIFTYGPQTDPHRLHPFMTDLTCDYPQL